MGVKGTHVDWFVGLSVYMRVYQKSLTGKKNILHKDLLHTFCTSLHMSPRKISLVVTDL